MITLTVTISADTPEERSYMDAVVFAMGKGLKEGLAGIAEMTLEIRHVAPGAKRP